MIHVFAAFVHGVLAFGHLLGFIWNAIKGQWIRAGVHAGSGIFSAYSSYQHAKDAEGGF